MPRVSRNGEQALQTVKVLGTNANGLLAPDKITVAKALALHP